MPINYQKNIFNENRDKNRFKSKEFVKMDNEEVIKYVIFYFRLNYIFYIQIFM